MIHRHCPRNWAQIINIWHLSHIDSIFTIVGIYLAVIFFKFYLYGHTLDILFYYKMKISSCCCYGTWLHNHVHMCDTRTSVPALFCNSILIFILNIIIKLISFDHRCQRVSYVCCHRHNIVQRMRECFIIIYYCMCVKYSFRLFLILLYVIGRWIINCSL